MLNRSEPTQSSFKSKSYFLWLCILIPFVLFSSVYVYSSIKKETGITDDAPQISLSTSSTKSTFSFSLKPSKKELKLLRAQEMKGKLESVPFANRYKTHFISPHPRNNVYATFIGSASFFPALEVFLYTLSEAHPVYSLALCIAEIDGYQELIKGMERILLKYDKKLNYEIFLWPVIPSPKDGNEHERWKINWTKLQLWTMLEYEKIFYVDLDVIFMKNIDDVFEHNPDFHQYLGTYDWGRWSPAGTQKLNGGVFMLKPSLETFRFLLQKRLDVHSFRAVEAEQGLFNSLFMNDKSCCLPVVFNTQKTIQTHIPALWHSKAIMVLHFTGEKPWTSWSSTAFRTTYVGEEEKKRLAGNDQWDADSYSQLHNFWKEKYFLAREYELKHQLTFYQFYHNDGCWGQLTRSRVLSYKYVKLNGPLRASEDVNASFYYPLLENSDYQLALGELGGMLALSKMNPRSLPPFIGISSWRAFIKEDWKEGASIDWTKVTFQRDSMYFWYSLYHPPNKTFYDVVEVHHRGMVKVMKEVIPYPLPRIPESQKRFVFSNYMILSKDLFLKYMSSVEEVMKIFFRKYPLGSKCPFDLPSDTVHPEKRCIGYLLERYINIWAYKNDVNFVYAVDHPEWRNS
jgi:lipopolysaccharide biosynthesis glycosyltransferase